MIRIVLTLLLMFALGSCKSTKRHCDAYGKIDCNTKTAMK